MYPCPVVLGLLVDDLGLAPILVLECDLGSLARGNRNGFGGIGIIQPVLICTIGFGNSVGTRLEIQGDHAGRISLVVSDYRTCRVLNGKMPTGNATAIGRSLNDLRLTSVLVGKGNSSCFIGLDRNCLGGSGVIDPILILGPL